MTPCPFCGSTDIQPAFGHEGGHIDAAECNTCGAEGPLIRCDTAYEANDAWNNRIPDYVLVTGLSTASDSARVIA